MISKSRRRARRLPEAEAPQRPMAASPPQAAAPRKEARQNHQRPRATKALERRARAAAHLSFRQKAEPRASAAQALPPAETTLELEELRATPRMSQEQPAATAALAPPRLIHAMEHAIGARWRSGPTMQQATRAYSAVTYGRSKPRASATPIQATQALADGCRSPHVGAALSKRQPSASAPQARAATVVTCALRATCAESSRKRANVWAPWCPAAAPRRNISTKSGEICSATEIPRHVRVGQTRQSTKTQRARRVPVAWRVATQRHVSRATRARLATNRLPVPIRHTADHPFACRRTAPKHPGCLQMSAAMPSSHSRSR